MSGIRLRDQRAGNSATTTIEVERGPGYLPDDVIIATVVLRNSATITPPADFTLIDSVTLTTVFTMALYYHVVEAVDYTLAPYEWTVSSVSTGWHVMHAVFRGVDADAPVEADYLAAANTDNATVPAQATGGNRFSLLVFGARDTATLTPDSALKELYDGTGIASRPAGWMGWAMEPLAGDVGAFSFSIAAAQRMGVAHVMLKPSIVTLTLPDIAGATRVTIADRSGMFLAEILPTLAPLSWRLNKAGRGKLEFFLSDPAMVEDVLQIGNLVLVEFENGLQAWGGFIETDRRWTTPGGAVVDLYDGVQLLKHRITAIDSTFTSASPAEVFESVITDTNGLGVTPITVGSLDGGDERITAEYHYADVQSVIQELCGRWTTNEFLIEPDTTQNRLTFVAGLWRRVGRVQRNVALIEGHNMVDVNLLEQGPIVNSLEMVGAGSNWDDRRLTVSVEDEDSIARYGPRRGSEIRSDVTLQEALDAEAAITLAATAIPRPVWDVYVVNVAPALFISYGIGDTVRMMAHSIGFNNEGADWMVRVLEREYDPYTGVCRLIVEDAGA